VRQRSMVQNERNCHGNERKHSGQLDENNASIEVR
jgi:hypothetical protein